MKSSSKQNTITSFFSSSAAKRQKTSTEQSNLSTISSENEEVASCEAPNLSSVVDLNLNKNIDSITTDNHSTLTTILDISLSPSSSSSTTQLIPPCLLSIEARSPTVDFTSPNDIRSSSSEPLLQSASPATSSSVTPIRSHSLLVSPTLFALPTDISRTLTDPPVQPILSSYKNNHDNRSFQKQWFINRPWLIYSIKNDKIYCFYCRHFGSTSPLINRNQSDSFIRGCNNWKSALDKKKGLPKHESSLAHITATANYNEYLLREKSKQNVINPSTTMLFYALY